jgi:anti-sigma B factor antagonist
MTGIKVFERQSGGVTILDLEGDVIFGEGANTLRKETRRLFAQGHADILLNLAKVRYIDSSGMGEMVSALMAARREGGQLGLLGMSPNVRKLFEITKLTTVFNIYADERSAIGDAVGR